MIIHNGTTKGVIVGHYVVILDSRLQRNLKQKQSILFIVLKLCQMKLKISVQMSLIDKLVMESVLFCLVWFVIFSILVIYVGVPGVFLCWVEEA